jgi:hypothetical protein
MKITAEGRGEKLKVGTPLAATSAGQPKGQRKKVTSPRVNFVEYVDIYTYGII